MSVNIKGGHMKFVWLGLTILLGSTSVALVWKAKKEYDFRSTIEERLRTCL